MPSPPRSARIFEPERGLDHLFRQAIARKVFSGASLAVAGPDGIHFQGSWGVTLEGGTAVNDQTAFDLASLTKPLVTASLCARAVGEGLIDLDTRLGSLLPGCLVPASKRDISIRHLLNHSSALPPHEPFFLELIRKPRAERRDAMLSSILTSPLCGRPGSVSRYSDLGFILLGMLLENLLQSPLDTLAASFLSPSIFSDALHYRRMETSMDPTHRPPRPWTAHRAYAATELCPWRQRLLVGEAHDENAHVLDGVAGHAGLFGTASGVARWLGRLWELYRGRAAHDLWSPAIMHEFWDRPAHSPEGTWALGFDTPTPRGSSAGHYFSPHSVGHLGFTGTSFWLDLDRGIMVVLLTNRVYPSRCHDAIKVFRPMAHDLVMKGIHGI
jgi:CubicO group peptidase (beta-lactamase class C family)